MNKQNGKRLIDTQNKMMVASREGVWGAGEKEEGVKKNKLVGTK